MIEEEACNGRILICIRIMTHVPPHQDRPKQTRRHASKSLSEHHSVVPKVTPPALRIPPPRELSYSEHLPEHHPVVPEATPHASSETSTAANFIDFYLQFSKQDSLDLRSQLRRKICSSFERRNNPCSTANGYKWQQKSLSIM